MSPKPPHVLLSAHSVTSKMPEQLNKFHTSIKEPNWAIRDAVVEGFRFHNGNLKWIGTAKLMDNLRNNAELRFSMRCCLEIQAKNRFGPACAA